MADRHRILQVEPTALYGSLSWSTFSLSQLIHWSTNHGDNFSRVQLDLTPLLRDRAGPSSSGRYAFTLQPALAAAAGPLIFTLISTQAAPQLSFQLIDGFARLPPSAPIHLLPGSKHDLFTRSDLSLLDKRRLVRLFQHVIASTIPTDISNERLAGFLSREPYMLSSEPINQLAALALSTRYATAASASQALARLQTLLHSIGRYGTANTSSAGSGYLLPQHGGPGEWVEALVRASAVAGGAVQIVGRQINKLEQISGKEWIIQLQDDETPLHFTARHLIIGSDHARQLLASMESRVAYFVLRAIVVLNAIDIEILQLITTDDENSGTKHALVVVEMDNTSCPVQVLVVGEGAECCPAGEGV